MIIIINDNINRTCTSNFIGDFYDDEDVVVTNTDNYDVTATDNFIINIPMRFEDVPRVFLEWLQKHFQPLFVFKNLLYINKINHKLSQPPYMKRYRMDRLIGKREKRIGLRNKKW